MGKRFSVSICSVNGPAYGISRDQAKVAVNIKPSRYLPEKLVYFLPHNYFSYQSSYLKHPKLTEIIAHNQITAEAHCDTLTGLLNKDSFQCLLDQQIELALISGRVLWVLFADIDDFKIINDSFGHGEGIRYCKKLAYCFNTPAANQISPFVM